MTDMIRKSDALDAAHEADSLELSTHGASKIVERIEALPAVTVGADAVLDAAHEYMVLQYGASPLGHPIDRARILAALTPTPVDASQAADAVVNAPTSAAIRIADEVCDFFDAKGQNAEAFGAAEVGQRLRDAMQTGPAAIREAWGKAYWRMRSYAIHDDNCKLNKPPRFDGPCSCGLTAALEETLALIAKGAAE